MESLAIMLSAVAGGSVIFITGLSLYFKIRHRFPVRVNCWFCNKCTDVPYGNRNCWDCPSCEQYNGFLSDGNYNKTIPAQHDELLNHPVHAISPRKKSPLDANGNGLCRKCNINQELKVQQLAVFMPINPAHYDEEVDEYRHHLERAYRLCSPCEEVLKQTLHKQKSMVLGFKLKQLHDTSLHKGVLSVLKRRCFQFYLSWNHVARYFTALLAACLVLAASVHLNNGRLPLPVVVQNSTLWRAVEVPPHFANLVPVTLMYEIPLTAFGMVTQFVASMPSKPGKVGVMSVCFWIMLHTQSWLKRWKKLEQYISLLDFNTVHVVVALLTLCVCTLDALVARRRSYTAVKCHNVARTLPPSPNTSSESACDISNVSDDIPTSVLRNRQQDHVNSSSSCEGDIKLPKVCDFYPIGEISAPSSRCIERSPSSITSAYEDVTSEDLDRGFGNLTLGSPSYEKWMSRKNNSISSFGTKVYGQNRCSGLFSGSLRNRKRPIIRPSQLSLCKNVTQSSWVAGGYWQSAAHNRTHPASGNELQETYTAAGFVPLSRSSSQSSGFVSQSSQPGICDGATSLPNSRTGSTCGADFDRFSALSEPVCSYTVPPVYYTGAKPGTFAGAPYYGGPPVFTHQAYSVVPQLPAFLPNYGSPLLPQPQPIPCYYSPQPPRQLSPIWNPSAFSLVPAKQPQMPSADVSRSSSQNSNHSEGSVGMSSTKTAPQRRRTFVSAMRENLFLAVLFSVSLLFNALILVCVMLWNSSMLLPGILS